MTEAKPDSEGREVATRQFEGLDLPARKILSVSGDNEVERVEQTVVLPAIYQYSINRWPAGQRVMLTSDAYDYINRVMGVQFWQPKYVHDEHGERQLNPIHRPSQIYLRLVGIWRNDAGQMVSYQEDIEVDYNLTYQDSRINSKSMKIVTDKDGAPVFGDNGMPKFTLDPDDEKKALRALSQLRTFGLRYVQTVAKTRILKTASGIRQLPIEQPRDFPIRVVGFRDNLTPDERIKRAEEDMTSMFGPTTKLDENVGLTSEELATIRELEAADLTEENERELVNSAEEERASGDIEIVDSQGDAPIRRVGPETEEEIPWDLSDEALGTAPAGKSKKS
jgi:hypothetical protein